MSQEIIIPKKYAKIQEVKGLPKPNDNMIRVWCDMYPEHYNFQIRYHGPINGPYGEGKARDMIATVNVSIEELENILAEMKKYKAGEPSAFSHIPQEAEETK